MVEPYPAAAGLRRRQARAEAEGLVAMPPQPRPPPPPPAVVVPPAQQQQQQQRRPSWRFSHIYCFVSFLIALVAIVGAPIREKSTNTSSVSSTTTTTSSFRHVFGSLKDATTTNTDDSLWMGGDTSGGSNNGGGDSSSSSSSTTTTDATLSESGSSTTTTSNNLAPLWPNTATAPFFHWFDDFIMSDYFVFYNDGQQQQQQQQQQKEEELKKAKLLQKQKEQQQQQVPAWIRWALPPPKQQQQQQQQPPIQKQQQQKKSFSEYVQHFFHQQWLKIKPFLDPNIFHPQVGWTSVVDKILTSTPRLLLITNWLLSVTYLVHYAVARMFLGTSATTNNNNNGGPNNNNNNATDTPPPNKGGFLLFKLLLISAVIGPDTLDWLILLCWYTLLSFLKSLASLARQTLERQTAATTIQERRGVLQLLLWVLAWDILSAASCVGLFYQAGWDMVLLLTSDCVLLGLETCSSCMLHVHQSLVTNHERQVQQVEEEILAIHQRAREEATTRTSAAAAAATAAAAAMTTEATQWEEAAAAAAGADDDDDEGVVVDQVMEDLNEDDDDDDGIVVDNDHSSHGDNSVTGGGDGQEASSPGTRQQQQQQQQQPPPYIPDPSLTTDLEQQLESMELLHYKRVGILESVVFWLELWNHVITILHFCHVWKLHSLQFTLIDGVLLIHLHSAVSNAMKKIAQRRNYLRIARDLDGLFQDANDVDMKKAGDLCCICLGSMTTSGSVKKVGCGHVFHTHCLREVVERARSIETAQCPLCRARVLDGSSPNNTNNDNNNGAGTQAGGGGAGGGAGASNNNNNTTRGLGGTATTGGGNNNNNDDNNNNNNNEDNNNNGGTAAPAVEHSLFRFSTEGLLPFLPAFSFEVVRRPAAGEQQQQQQQDNNGENNNNNGPTATNQNNNNAGQQQQQSLLQQVLWSLAAAGGGNTTTALHHQQLSPEQEANVLNGLVDMFPQYDRSDLLRELRRRNGSGEAVVESILIGTFRGEARGRSNGAGIGGMTMMRQQQQ